jgi:hypothetical protein
MIRSMVSIGILLCIALFIPAENASAGCTRESLQTAVDSYLAAQKAGDASKMTLVSPLIKYTQNMKEVTADKGLWNTALPISFSRSFLDVETCQTFTEVIIAEGAPNPYVLGTKLKVENGKIAEIDSLVTQKGDWLFNAADYLKYSSKEDWSVVPRDKRPTRQTLIDAGNGYLDLFGDKNAKVPWGTPCARLEGGAYTSKNFDDPNASCNVGVPTGQLKIVSRTYVVDVDMGTVIIVCRFGAVTGMPDSHMFRLIDGKLRYVHTLSVAVTDQQTSAPKQPMPKAPNY